MQTYTCANCGRTFEDYPANRIKGQEHCCNRRCKGEYQTKKAIEKSRSAIMIICSSCGKEKPVTDFYKEHGKFQAKCKDCIKQIRRDYYDLNAEEVRARVKHYQDLHPGRPYHGPTVNYAQGHLNHELKKGRLTRPDKCEKCGKVGRLHAHHWHGYDKPLDVIWLCPSCHHAAHGRGPKARAGSLPPGSLDDATQGDYFES